jgi:hypothetical protein
MTFADRLVLYVLLGLGVVLALTGARRAPGASVLIEGPDGFERVVPLSSSDTIWVPGPLGETVVEVRDGAVRVTESPCPHGLCVRMGKVRSPGQSVVCVPNRVVVTVAGDGDATTDAITR